LKQVNASQRHGVQIHNLQSVYGRLKCFISNCGIRDNRAKLLGATLESILGRKFSVIEVIVVDDGSSDETERVVNS
jgi:cellulose synthase/poly-beta-1,6-N-acetylglucosamine synthase-like glycosyltransferase